MMKIPSAPSLVMAATWLVFMAIFFAVPISYDNQPTVKTWVAIIGFVILFAVFAEAGARIRPGVARDQAPTDLNRLVTVCAVAGLVGAIAIVIDKLALNGFDWSDGLMAAREKRSVEVIAGIPGRRTVLTYIGYVLLPFSMVALVGFILEGERLRRTAGYLGQVAIVPMVIYAVVYGGRMPVLMALLLIVGACFTRKVQSRSLLPKGWHLVSKITVMALLLSIYTAHVFSDRRQMNQIQTFDRFLEVAKVKWGLQVDPDVQSLVKSQRLPAGLTMDAVSTLMYLTHGPTTVEKILRTQEPMPALLGVYQVGILSPLLDAFFPQSHVPAQMRSQLQSADLFGWFPTAWGALILDFGVWGAVLFTTVWGSLAGILFQRLRSGGGTADRLLGSFVVMAILISPLNGPLGMANSFEIFVTFCFVSLVLYLRTPLAKYGSPS